MFYIGQTGRKIDKRMAEHKPVAHRNNLQNSHQKSRFAQHLIEKGHNFGNAGKNVKIIHNRKKGRILDSLEEFKIYKSWRNDETNILNEKLNYKSHILFNKILQREQTHRPIR